MSHLANIAAPRIFWDFILLVLIDQSTYTFCIVDRGPGIPRLLCMGDKKSR
jgi:hypothetical protein